MPIGKIWKREKLKVWKKRGKGLSLTEEFCAALCSTKWGIQVKAARNVEVDEGVLTSNTT